MRNLAIAERVPLLACCQTNFRQDEILNSESLLKITILGQANMFVSYPQQNWRALPSLNITNSILVHKLCG